MGWDDDESEDSGLSFRSKPIPVPNGIKARSQRGSVPQTWWAGRWMAALESIVPVKRLARGRSYARDGQVISLEVSTSGVTALVQGSVTTPYKVTIRFLTLLDPEWARVFDVMAGQALYAAMLLNGQMPEEIETVFTAAGTHLFPATRRELITNCSCLDSFYPCRHVAAVQYLLGERFDDDPFLICTMRGRTREQIAEALAARRATVPDRKAALRVAESPPPLEHTLPSDPVAFWRLPETVQTLRAVFSDPEITASPIRSRGRPPFWDGSLDFMEAMNETYAAIAEFAYRLAHDES